MHCHLKGQQAKIHPTPQSAPHPCCAMYEARHQPVLKKTAFYQRMALHGLAALVLVTTSIGIGMTGYMLTEGMAALDAFLNAAMLLGGMGPVSPLTTAAGKWFASLFALYAGLVFVACSALVLTPVLHRLLHHFHADDKI